MLADVIMAVLEAASEYIESKAKGFKNEQLKHSSRKIQIAGYIMYTLVVAGGLAGAVYLIAWLLGYA